MILVARCSMDIHHVILNKDAKAVPRQLGHRTSDIHPKNRPIQHAWFRKGKHQISMVKTNNLSPVSQGSARPGDILYITWD